MPLGVQETCRNLLQQQQQQEVEEEEEGGNHNQDQHVLQQQRQYITDPNPCSQESKSGISRSHVSSSDHDMLEQPPTSRQDNLCPHPGITFTLTDDNDDDDDDEDNQSTKPLKPGTESDNGVVRGNRGVGSDGEDPVENGKEREDRKGQAGENGVRGNGVTDEERVSERMKSENGGGKHMNMEEGKGESMKNGEHSEQKE